MAEPFLSELKIFGFNFAPRGWAQCDGQILPINLNQSLYSLLGTTYGGDGSTTFALPDLRGRVPMHVGPIQRLGDRGGEERHTLNISEIPAHTHQAVASTGGPTVKQPTDNFWASNTGFAPYGTSPDVDMSSAAISTVGANQSHENMSPYLALNICIALQGLFPSRN